MKTTKRSYYQLLVNVLELKFNSQSLPYCIHRTVVSLCDIQSNSHAIKAGWRYWYQS